jgi:transcriptional regulator with XRE-family HTH domain
VVKEQASIAAAVARLRKERRLSLDGLAQLSGVSRSMLHDIEKDRTNPTVGIALRLASAFGVELSELLSGSPPTPIIDFTLEKDTPWLASGDGGCRLRILGHLPLAGRLEWYLLTANPKSRLASAPHQLRTTEHLSVLKGALVVSVGDTKHDAPAGSTIRYRADVPHVIQNDGKTVAEAILVVVMEEGIAKAR